MDRSGRLSISQGTLQTKDSKVSLLRLQGSRGRSATSKDYPKRTTKSRSRRAVVRFAASTVSPRLPPCAPHCAPSAAARAGAAAAKLGCESEPGKAKKCFSVCRRVQSTAGHSRRGQAGQRRPLGRTGTGCRGCAGVAPRAGSGRGGGAATAAAWAGPCAHHLGDAEGSGDSSRSADTRMLPPRLQPQAGLTIAPRPLARRGARAGHPNSPRLRSWSSNFLSAAARSPAPGSCREAGPEPPAGGGDARGGAAAARPSSGGIRGV